MGEVRQWIHFQPLTFHFEGFKHVHIANNRQSNMWKVKTSKLQLDALSSIHLSLCSHNFLNPFLSG